MTVVEAIKEVLTTLKKPLTSREIYKEVISRGLYEFGSKTPEAIVKAVSTNEYTDQ